MTRLAFTKQRRLLKAHEFRRVFDQSCIKASSRALLILGASNQLTHSRIGFIIAKKQVRSAVERNRIKRVIRESFRLLDSSSFQFDLVVLVRKEMALRSNSEIKQEFERLWFKLNRHKSSQKEGVSNA